MLWHPKGYSGIAFREESLDFTLFPKFAIFIFFCRRRRCSCCLQNPKVFRKNQNFSCPEKYFFGAKNFTSYYFAWKGSARRAQQWWAGRLVGRLIPLHYCKAFSPHHLRFLKATSPSFQTRDERARCKCVENCKPSKFLARCILCRWVWPKVQLLVGVPWRGGFLRCLFVTTWLQGSVP